MFTLTRTTALVAGSAVLAIPTAVLVSAPAQADVERRGACGSGHYELSVDREAQGFEVSADLENVAAGTRWKIVLKHDGHRFFHGTRTADHEGDLDVERFRNNTAGKDTFKMRVTRLNGAVSCTAKVTVR